MRRMKEEEEVSEMRLFVCTAYDSSACVRFISLVKHSSLKWVGRGEENREYVGCLPKVNFLTSKYSFYHRPACNSLTVVVREGINWRVVFCLRAHQF